MFNLNIGPGLAFVSYPEAIAQFGWTPQVGLIISLYALVSG